PTTPTLCVRRSRNAAPGRASNRCPDASTLRLSVPFFIATETSSSASSTNSSTSAPSPRDTKNTPTTTSHSSSSLPSEYGCDLMSLCLRADRAKSDSRNDPIWCVNLLYLFDVDRMGKCRREGNCSAHRDRAQYPTLTNRVKQPFRVWLPTRTKPVAPRTSSSGKDLWHPPPQRRLAKQPACGYPRPYGEVGDSRRSKHAPFVPDAYLRLSRLPRASSGGHRASLQRWPCLGRHADGQRHIPLLPDTGHGPAGHRHRRLPLDRSHAGSGCGAPATRGTRRRSQFGTGPRGKPARGERSAGRHPRSTLRGTFTAADG